MTAPQCKAQVAEITQLCGYLRSDTAIANYLGIPTEQVTGVRSRMRVRGTLKPPAHYEKPRRWVPPSSPVERDPCPRCGQNPEHGPCRHAVQA